MIKSFSNWIIVLLLSTSLKNVRGEEEVCLLTSHFSLDDPLRIGAWNAQKLGKKKMSDPKIVDALIKIMLRYDIIVLQEVTDYTQETPIELLDRLNEAAYFTSSDFDPNDALSEPANEIYEIAMSARIGRKRYKEQYVFYYREDKVILNKTLQYEDVGDKFHIEPFVAIFELPTSEVKRVAVIPIHTSPSHAPAEIDALVDVYDYVFEHFGVEDAIILGDFNGGCNYVRTDDWEGIRLHTDQRFEWLISDHVDTTTKGTSCPYDRIVVAGTSLKEALYEKTAKPFYFDDALHITDQDFIEDISDHYPVEVLLQHEVSKTSQVKNILEFGVSVEIHSTPSSVEQLKRSCLNSLESKESLSHSHNTQGNFLEGGYGTLESEEVFERSEEEVDDSLLDVRGRDGRNFQNERDDVEGRREPNDRISNTENCANNSQVVFAHPDLLIIDFHSKNINEVMTLLDNLESKHPCLFTHRGVSILKYKLNHGVLKDASVYGEMPQYSGVKTRVHCLEAVCSVSITRQTTIV